MKSVLAELVPADVVTTTLADPLLPEGVVQVAAVEDKTVTLVQAFPPTVMLVAPVRLVPVMVMVVPPEELPVLGDTAVTVGVHLMTLTLLPTLA